jgi:DNA-directed RNA polymerase subunit RPC12/RpoP
MPDELNEKGALIKCGCPHCGEKIEFPSEYVDRTCDCPHCGKKLQLPPLPVKTSLRTCPDCGKDISVRAEACPHCGAPFIKKKNTSGLGCPNCGSQNIYQRTHSSGAGIGLFIGGIVLAFFTCGIGLVLCVIAVFLNEKRGHCRDCKWTWKT